VGIEAAEFICRLDQPADLRPWLRQRKIWHDSGQVGFGSLRSLLQSHLLFAPFKLWELQALQNSAKIVIDGQAIYHKDTHSPSTHRHQMT
jgi:hypothetical protein